MTYAMDQITNKRRVDDELREQWVIHVLELVINHTRSSHGHNYVEIMDDIAVGSIDAKLRQNLIRPLLFLDERPGYDDESGLCTQVTDTILSLLVYIIEKAHLCPCLKSKTVITLASYNPCIH